jgi:hypothetical protein
MEGVAGAAGIGGVEQLTDEIGLLVEKVVAESEMVEKEAAGKTVELAGRELVAKAIGKFGKVDVLRSEMAVEVAWSWPVAAETIQGAGLGVE